MGSEEICTEGAVETCILQKQLEEYVSQDLYPLHMPGHKRRVLPAPGLPYDWDVTEVPGTDDLHDAHGILEEAMKRTAALYGADRTWYLVNGSTCGLLAGIRALAGRGSEVLCARNCHKAVFHALELAGFRVRWILPPIDPVWGICGSIRAGQVEAAIRRHPGIRALILTSPTYEGVLSDIEGICRVCHDRKIPVLVDEAHGLGVFGRQGRGVCNHFGLTKDVDLIMGTFSKSLASIGGFIAGNQTIIDSLRHTCRTYIFSASMTPAATAAALEALHIIQNEPERIQALWDVTNYALKRFKEEGFEIGETQSPIIPLYVRDMEKTFIVVARAFEEGVFINPVIPPACAPSDTLVRYALMANHTKEQVDESVIRLKKVFKELDIIK